MKTVYIYTDGEDGCAASQIKSRPARRLRGNRRRGRLRRLADQKPSGSPPARQPPDMAASAVGHTAGRRMTEL